VSEHWLPIPDFPGYEVSDHGRVRSYWTLGAGDHYNWHIAEKPRRVLHPHVNHGYAQVILSNDGRRRTCKVHQLVLQAFVGPCPDGMISRHLDGNRKNNHLRNLKWGTYSENMQDSLKHGTHISGWLSLRKLKPQQVRQIRREYARGSISTRALGEKWNVPKSTIHRLCSGQVYQECPGPVFPSQQGNRSGPNV